MFYPFNRRREFIYQILFTIYNNFNKLTKINLILKNWWKEIQLF